jgi:choline dehydrogenase-like flavoprotein
LTDVFDVIVVGGGSAGCVLANRLSADPRRSVLLLEAGGEDDWIWFHIPVGYLFAIGNPRADWMFRTEPVPGLGGRSLNYARGKVIGGSSAINAMIYMRGQAADYDRWRAMGLAGWGWDDVLPLFLAQEDHIDPPSDHHRRGGEWRVEHPRVRWRILDAFAEAAAAAGIPATRDFNTGDNAGVGYFQVNQKAGRRWSAARGFLAPARKRANLKVVTGATARRIVIADGRAVGVQFDGPGGLQEVRARGEVVLAAGAIGTPHLLELSGLGDGPRLRAAGLAVERHLPGVGENLQDHLQIRSVYGVAGVPTLNTLYAEIWRRPLMALEYALFRRGPLDAFGQPLHPYPAFTISVCNLRPGSRGSVHAVGPDPAMPPAIQPNYLATPRDQEVAVRSLRLVRRIADQAPLQRFSARELAPGAAASSDAELLDAARALSTTIFHPVGTARMGPPADAAAVVDQRLRVHGLDGLRIADASVMPTITSGNTNSPTLMIAEKAARMIIADAKG